MRWISRIVEGRRRERTYMQLALRSSAMVVECNKSTFAVRDDLVSREKSQWVGVACGGTVD